MPRLLSLTISVVLCLLATAGSAAGADSADVSLDLRDASGRAGEPVFYALPVFNAGPATATGVVVIVQLAPGLELVNGGSGCTTSGSTVSCTIDLIPAGQGAVLPWELRAAEPGTYDISGSVSADQPDPVPGNNLDSAQIVVAPSDADVSIDLQDASARAGEAFFYAFAVGNAGPGTASNVVATIELPSGIELVDGGFACTQSGRIVTCSFGSIGARTGLFMPWLLRAADAGTYTISGAVTADQPDGAPANNSDSATITVTAAADLGVAVSDSMDPVKPGQGVTYTTIVTNNGPSTATNVALSGAWSMSSTKEVFVGDFTTTQGSCVPVGIGLECQLGTLAPGGSATVTIALKPRGGGVLTMSAHATATEPDPNAANNSETETTTVGPK